jgi:hypothetical protein
MLITTCFDPYWVIIGCISVYVDAEFLFSMDPYFSSYLTISLCDYCLVNLWFVYSSAFSRLSIKLNYSTLKLKEC